MRHMNGGRSMDEEATSSGIRDERTLVARISAGTFPLRLPATGCTACVHTP